MGNAMTVAYLAFAVFFGIKWFVEDLRTDVLSDRNPLASGAACAFMAIIWPVFLIIQWRKVE